MANWVIPFVTPREDGSGAASLTRIMLTLHVVGVESASSGLRLGCSVGDSREREAGDAGDGEDRADRDPQRGHGRGRELARLDVAGAGGREEVEAGEEDEAGGPEAHAKVVHARVVEVPEEEGHAAQLEEDGDAARDAECVPDLCGLLEKR